MSDGERTQVGQALDALQSALSTYVDEAMVSGYGENWDDLVADDDAKRRTDGRRFPVRKNDLAVMLKVLIHRRIEPWSRLREYQRLRGYAGEILTLRNLHAHGHDCAGEASRLMDTSSRMLALLGIAVPQELQAPRLDLASIPASNVTGALAAQQPPSTPRSRADAEIAHLGEAGQQAGEILQRASQLQQTLVSAYGELLAAVDPEAPDLDAFRRERRSRELSIGQDAIGLLADLERIEIADTEPTDPALALLLLLARRQLTTDSLGECIDVLSNDLRRQVVDAHERRSARLNELLDAGLESATALSVEDSQTELRRLEQRLTEVDRLMDAMGSDHFSQEIQNVASQLGEASSLANFALAMDAHAAALSSKGDDGHWTREALPHLGDAISHVRFEAGMEAGRGNESALVTLLRLQGEVYNDLGQSEDALASFARASEIVDRYPSADPDLPA